MPQRKNTTSSGTATPVTDRLRADILSGRFSPGSRLIEADLTKSYEVGRAAIRSALATLDGEGLVTRESNRGATVRRISVSHAIEITDVRTLLEGLAARLAAERATSSERLELRTLISAMKQAVKGNDLRTYSNLNTLLHRRLREMARHSVVEDLVANLANRAAHHQFRLATVSGRPTESLAQHKAVVDAIVAGDADAAEAAMRAHLNSVANVLRHWNDDGVTN